MKDIRELQGELIWLIGSYPCVGILLWENTEVRLACEQAKICQVPMNWLNKQVKASYYLDEENYPVLTNIELVDA